MAAAEVMNLSSNFFDDVYEKNILNPILCKQENTSVNYWDNDDAFLPSRKDGVPDGRGDLPRILSLDNESIRSSSPSTDLAHEDIDWVHVDTDEEERGKHEEDSPVKPKEFLQQPHGTCHEPCAATNSNQRSTTNPAPSSWHPFGLPIPPLLVWLNLMNQKAGKVPISRRYIRGVQSGNRGDEGKDEEEVKATATSRPSEGDQMRTHQHDQLETARSPITSKPQRSKKQQRPAYTMEERKRRNREAASLSRLRKKKETVRLKQEILHLKRLLEEKEKHIGDLERENSTLKSQLGWSGKVVTNVDTSSSVDSVIAQPDRKRRRFSHHRSDFITTSLKVGVACAAAMCIFTGDGFSTAFVFDHVAHADSHVSLMKFTNWFFTTLILSLFACSYIAMSCQKKNPCRKKAASLLLLPLFHFSNSYTSEKNISMRFPSHKHCPPGQPTRRSMNDEWRGAFAYGRNYF